MQRCLLVAQTVRLLDTSCSTSQDKTAILGLEHQQVEEHMPSEKVKLQNFMVFIVKVIDRWRIKRDLQLLNCL